MQVRTIRCIYSADSCIYSVRRPFEFEINTAFGEYTGVGKAALEAVDDVIHDPLNTLSITLTCGKLTTGVTVPAWSAIFMLRNLSSPETYF